MANSKALLVFALVLLLVLSACQSQEITGAAIGLQSGQERTVTSPVVNIDVKPSTPSEPGFSLPQNHDYYVTLRNYLLQFDEHDYAIPPGTILDIDTDKLDAMSEEELFKLGINFGFVSGVTVPPYNGLRAWPSWFTLDVIEGHYEDDWAMRERFLSATGLTWWATWDYPDNQFYDLPQVKNRAWAKVLVDMILYDWHWENDPSFFPGSGCGHHCANGQMIPWAYTYYHLKDHLPPDVQEAFEAIYMKFWNRIEGGFHSGQEDMSMRSAIAMWFFAEVADIAEQENLYQRAIDNTQMLLDFENGIHPAGYATHNRRFDPSYAGVTIHYLAKLAQYTKDDPNYQFLRDRLDLINKFRAHISFPEPGHTRLHSFQHTGGAHGTVVGDQPVIATYGQRDWAIAFMGHEGTLDEEWSMYHQWTGRNNRLSGRWSNLFGWPLNIGDPGFYSYGQNSVARGEINRVISGLNNEFSDPGYDENDLSTWNWHHWEWLRTYSYDFYPEGYLTKVEEWETQNNPLRKLPVERGEDYVRIFGENIKDYRSLDGSYMVAHFNDKYSVVISTSRLSGSLSGGLNGGGISAFWTPHSGSVLLGLTGTNRNTNQWNGATSSWDIWPVHAVAGRNSAGAFSSAMMMFVGQGIQGDQNIGREQEFELLDANGQVTENEEEAVAGRVVFGGSLGKKDGAPTNTGATVQYDNVLTSQSVNYEREFYVDEGGVRVTTNVTSDGTDDVEELYEIFPVHLGNGPSERDAADVKIFAFDDNTGWVEMSVEPIITSRIRVERYGENVYLNFLEPVSVSLSKDVWEYSGSSGYWTRNILIDLLGGNANMPVETSVKYIISPYENAVPS